MASQDGLTRREQLTNRNTVVPGVVAPHVGAQAHVVEARHLAASQGRRGQRRTELQSLNHALEGKHRSGGIKSLGTDCRRL